MSGHSHWATIRRKKDFVDAKKGRVFSKLARSLMAAARMGGGDINSNIRLKALVDEARAQRMPKDNVERAIKKGTGEIGGERLEEIVYEAYGPGGVAILIEVLTDNRNRAASEIRKLLDVTGGSLAGTGATAWIFEKKGLITVERKSIDENSLFELAVEAGADEIDTVGDTFQITCEPGSFEAVKKALLEKKVAIETAQVTRIPSTNVPLDEAKARRILKLMEDLDDHDDVQNVYANFELPEKILSEAG